MSKEKEGSQKLPYMYIVQPEISPPEASMQSQFRSVVEEKEVEIIDAEEESDEVLSDEIKVISSESVEQQDAVYSGNTESDKVVEVSTGVDTGKKPKPRRKPSSKKSKKFSDMPKTELLAYLARIPGAVPKPMCLLTVQGDEVMGQVQKKKGDTYIVKISLGDRSKMVSLAEGEIDHIEVINLG
ncbi:MAG: CotO family spore coat protein [Bacillus sp. (in: firmicutes)]